MTLPPSTSTERIVLLIFLALAAWASFNVFRPYIEPILLALIVGMLAGPLHHRLHLFLPRWPNLTALISCLAISLLIILPALAMIAAVVHQGVVYAGEVKSWVSSGGLEQLLAHDHVTRGRALLEELLPASALDPDALRERIMAAASGLGSNFLAIGGKVASGLTGLLVEFMLMLFVLFFVLRDHESLISAVRHAVPLSRSQEDSLLTEAESVARSALLGTLLTALTQGIVGGIAMSICGFPGLFWGAVIAFASLIPVVGTALVWAPAAAFLAISGEGGYALFLVIWGVVVIGGIDNIVRPLFMQGASSLNTLLLFFALLGGLNSFGLMGLLYGPLIIALTLVLFRLYEHEFRDFLHRQDNS